MKFLRASVLSIIATMILMLPCKGMTNSAIGVKAAKNQLIAISTSTTELGSQITTSSSNSSLPNQNDSVITMVWNDLHEQKNPGINLLMDQIDQVARMHFGDTNDPQKNVCVATSLKLNKDNTVDCQILAASREGLSMLLLGQEYTGEVAEIDCRLQADTKSSNNKLHVIPDSVKGQYFSRYHNQGSTTVLPLTSNGSASSGSILLDQTTGSNDKFCLDTIQFATGRDGSAIRIEAFPTNTNQGKSTTTTTSTATPNGSASPSASTAYSNASAQLDNKKLNLLVVDGKTAFAEISDEKVSSSTVASGIQHWVIDGAIARPVDVVDLTAGPPPSVPFFSKGNQAGIVIHQARQTPHIINPHEMRTEEQQRIQSAIDTSEFLKDNLSKYYGINKNNLDQYIAAGINENRIKEPNEIAYYKLVNAVNVFYDKSVKTQELLDKITLQRLSQQLTNNLSLLDTQEQKDFGRSINGLIDIINKDIQIADALEKQQKAQAAIDMARQDMKNAIQQARKIVILYQDQQKTSDPKSSTTAKTQGTDTTDKKPNETIVEEKKPATTTAQTETPKESSKEPLTATSKTDNTTPNVVKTDLKTSQNTAPEEPKGFWHGVGKTFLDIADGIKNLISSIFSYIPTFTKKVVIPSITRVAAEQIGKATANLLTGNTEPLSRPIDPLQNNAYCAIPSYRESCDPLVSNGCCIDPVAPYCQDPTNTFCRPYNDDSQAGCYGEYKLPLQDRSIPPQSFFRSLNEYTPQPLPITASNNGSTAYPATSTDSANSTATAIPTTITNPRPNTANNSNDVKVSKESKAAVATEELKLSFNTKDPKKIISEITQRQKAADQLAKKSPDDPQTKALYYASSAFNQMASAAISDLDTPTQGVDTALRLMEVSNLFNDVWQEYNDCMVAITKGSSTAAMDRLASLEAMTLHPIDSTIKKFTDLAHLVTKTSCFIGRAAVLAINDPRKLDQKITALVQATTEKLANTPRHVIIEKVAEFVTGSLFDAYIPVLKSAGLAKLKAARNALTTAAIVEEKMAKIASKFPGGRRAAMPVNQILDDIGEIGNAASKHGVQETVSALKEIGKDASLVTKGESLGQTIGRIVAPGVEKILDKVQTYEQARNQALKIVGNLGADSTPFIGRLGAGKGKIVGRQSANGKIRWRLDFDPKKGPHINVEDFSKGKGSNAIKIAIPFDGNEGTIETLLKQLNR